PTRSQALGNVPSLSEQGSTTNAPARQFPRRKAAAWVIPLAERCGAKCPRSSVGRPAVEPGRRGFAGCFPRENPCERRFLQAKDPAASGAESRGEQEGISPA